MRAAPHSAAASTHSTAQHSTQHTHAAHTATTVKAQQYWNAGSCCICLIFLLSPHPCPQSGAVEKMWTHCLTLQGERCLRSSEPPEHAGAQGNGEAVDVGLWVCAQQKWREPREPTCCAACNCPSCCFSPWLMRKPSSSARSGRWLASCSRALPGTTCHTAAGRTPHHVTCGDKQGNLLQWYSIAT